MMFRRVLVVGAGQMGAGIAQVVAASGREVALHDSQPGAVERGLEIMRRSLGKLHEKGGPEPDEVLGRVTGGRGAHRGRSVDRGHRRARRRQARALSRRRRGVARARRPRLEHVVDPDHRAGRGDVPARAGDRDALLQSRAGARARRGDPRRADLRRDGGGDRRAGPRPREDAGRGERLPGLRLEPDPDAVRQRGGIRADGGRGRGRGDRHRREARLRAPDGAAGARRPDRARHVCRDHGGAPRRARRPEVRAVPAAAPVYVAAGPSRRRKSGRGWLVYELLG